jgi:competence protein ComEA
MLKKVVGSLLVVATSTLFGMSVSELNHASVEDLMKINGIGKVKAAEIVAQRKKAPFTSLSDLSRVKGVGSKIIGNVQNDVTSAKKAKSMAKKGLKSVTPTTSTKGAKKALKGKATELKESQTKGLKSRVQEKKRTLKTKVSDTVTQKTPMGKVRETVKTKTPMGKVRNTVLDKTPMGSMFSR